MSSETTTATNKYPTKPITMIVPFSVGGSTDLLARSLEKVSVKYLGQSLVVVNKSGGTGAFGWNELASASPDGYTLGITSSDLLLLPLYGTTEYHYVTALEPIAQISNSSIVMVVQADKPWQNVRELTEYAKLHPGQLKFGHAGIGSPSHVVGETFAKIADINIKQVPFQGGNEAIAALLGGHIEIAFMAPAAVKEQIKSGTVRAFAVSSEKRSTDPCLVQIPTFNEQGLDVIFNNRFGVGVCKGLPPDVEAKLAEGFKAMISDPEFKRSMDALGVEMEYLGPKEAQKKWLDDNVTLTKIIQETGILDLIKGQKK